MSFSREGNFKFNTRGITLWTSHGRKKVEAVLHPKPHDNRRKPVRISTYTGKPLGYPKSRPQKPYTGLHVLIRRSCKRIYEQATDRARRTEAYRIWKHYSTTSRNYR